MKQAWAALLLAGAGAAGAQQPACPHASEATQAVLLGTWRAEFEGPGPAGTLVLEKHPLYRESFRGTIERDGERRALAGDVEDGEFTLEESADGIRIAATWIGEVVEGSCGREIRGSWKAEGEPAGRGFILRKQAP